MRKRKRALDLVKSLNSAFGQNAPTEKSADAPAQGAPVAVNTAAFKGKIADLEKLEGLLNEELGKAKTEGEKTAINRYLDTARAAIIEARLSKAHLTAKQTGKGKIDEAIGFCQNLLTNEDFTRLIGTEQYKYLAVKIHLALVELYSENKYYDKALASCKAAFAAVPAGSSSLWDCAIALGNVLIDKSGADAATALNTFNTLLGHDDKRGFTPEELNAYPLIGSVVPISNNNNEERLSQARVGRIKAMFASDSREVHIEARKESISIINNSNRTTKMVLMATLIDSLRRFADSKDNDRKLLNAILSQRQNISADTVGKINLNLSNDIMMDSLGTNGPIELTDVPGTPNG